MRIANPIYDVVFRFLMEDNKVAKIIIGALIGKTIKELVFDSTEKSVTYPGGSYPTVLRMDFAATIITETGEDKQVIIELQKAKYYLEVMRFRRYLGKQYENPNLKTEHTTKRGSIRIEGIPILPIYILGEKITVQEIPVIRVGRYYIDVATNEKCEFRHAFVEALTHDAVFVQIPYLTGKRRTDLEKLLDIFDQANIADTRNHILEIKEKDYPNRYHTVIRRLKKAMANQEVREKMEAEDDFINMLKHTEREIALSEERANQAERKAQEIEQQRIAEKRRADQAEQKVNEAKQKVNEAEQKVNEAEQKIDEERKSKIELIKYLDKIGTSIIDIARISKLETKDIQKILNS